MQHCSNLGCTLDIFIKVDRKKYKRVHKKSQILNPHNFRYPEIKLSIAHICCYFFQSFENQTELVHSIRFRYIFLKIRIRFVRQRFDPTLETKKIQISQRDLKFVARKFLICLIKQDIDKINKTEKPLSLKGNAIQF